MENSRDNSSHKLVHTMGWIVRKTLVLTSKIIILTFKFGLKFIISKLTVAPVQAQLESDDQKRNPYQKE